MSVIQPSEDPVIEPRVIWEQMLDRALNQYEYRGTCEKFVADMQCRGFTTDQVEDPVTETTDEN